MAKAKDRVAEVRPYVERALKDQQVRENVRTAFVAARDVYDELLGGRGATGVAARVATDEEIQANLRTAIEELRSAAQRVQGKEDHAFRNTMLLVLGLSLGVLFNPFTGRQTREWVKEKIFGPSETFTYDEQSGDGSTVGPTT
ncbi:MAG: hypothetical protein M3292_01125 [Actinomycetota bacterium]|nr:hypothetical protein [Actinomycetota bacterium]